MSRADKGSDIGRLILSIREGETVVIDRPGSSIRVECLGVDPPQHGVWVNYLSGLIYVPESFIEVGKSIRAQDVVVSCIRVKGRRATLRVEAPKAWPIRREESKAA